MGNGLSLKAGRFLSGVGYLNAQHAHIWDFVDAPLAYQAMLGTQFSDDGVQLTWLAPTDRFIELGAGAGPRPQLPRQRLGPQRRGHGGADGAHRRRHRRQPQLARRACRC